MINHPPRNCKLTDVAVSLLVWLDYFFSKFQADMKTTNLEETRIAMETYYEEVHIWQILQRGSRGVVVERKFVVGLGSLKSLFQLNWFYDYMECLMGWNQILIDIFVNPTIHREELFFLDELSVLTKKGEIRELMYIYKLHWLSSRH